MDILIIGLLLLLIYSVPRINFTKNKRIKKWSRSHFRYVATGERLIKHGCISVLGVILMGALYYLDLLKVPHVPYVHFGKGIVLVILSILAFVQLFFLASYIICSVWHLDQDATIKPVDLLAMDNTSFTYTGYVVPIVVAVYETYIYYYILIKVLSEKYNLSIGYVVAIIILLYGLFKAYTRREGKQVIAFLILGLSISTIGILLTLGSNIIIGCIYMFLILLFLAFKDVKIQTNIVRATRG